MDFLYQTDVKKGEKKIFLIQKSHLIISFSITLQAVITINIEVTFYQIQCFFNTMK